MASLVKHGSGSGCSGDTRRPSSSILDHANLPEDPEVGRLHRQGDVWDWDEHRSSYELAARRAMALVGDLNTLQGLAGAIARGLFGVATSADEDHFAVRTTGGESGVYKWPTVPSAEESRNVVVVGAFLGAKPDGESILEPQDIPIAVRRALILQRNVPVLIFMVAERGLMSQRFQLRPDFFARLMSKGSALDASQNDVHLTRRILLLAPKDLTARFKELFLQLGQPARDRRRAWIQFIRRSYRSWVR
jgi:hypothetical protein